MTALWVTITIMANTASLAGHVQIEDYAILGGFSGVHQFCRIGFHSMVAAGAKVTLDILSVCSWQEEIEARLAGLNSVGLKRSGMGTRAHFNY